MAKKNKRKSKSQNDNKVVEKDSDAGNKETSKNVASSELHVDDVEDKIVPSLSSNNDFEVSTSVKPNERNVDNNDQRSFNVNKNSRTYLNRANTRWSEPIKGRNEGFNDTREQKRYSQNEHVTERRQYNNSIRNDDTDRFKREQLKDEFKKYEENFRSTRGVVEYEKVTEIEQDLFKMSKVYSLAHCVAEDLNMGSGIAVQFRHEFKKVDELMSQNQKPGGLALLKDDDRYIYYLITKQFSSGKPTYWTLCSSLQKMREHIIDNKIKKLAMPRIGCGLDRLQWENVKFMIEYLFRNVDVKIIICNLQQIEESTPIKHRNSKVTNVTYPIEEIEPYTLILYFSSEDGFVSEEMKKLDNKFPFLNEFRVARKMMGDVIVYSKRENYLLCGCIVKKTQNDLIDFKALQKCLYNAQKTNKQYGLEYFGFQALKTNDSCLNPKIINLIRNTFRYGEIYVCWPGDLQKEMIARDRTSDYVPASERNNRSFGGNYNRSEGSWRNNSSDSSRFAGNCSFNSNADSRISENASATDVSFEIERSLNEDEDAEGNKSQTTETDWFNCDNKELKTSTNINRAANVSSQPEMECWDDDYPSVESNRTSKSREDQQRRDRGSGQDAWNHHTPETNHSYKSRNDRSENRNGRNEWRNTPPRDTEVHSAKKCKTADNRNVERNREERKSRVSRRISPDFCPKNKNQSQNEEDASNANHEFESYEVDKDTLDMENSVICERSANSLPKVYSRAYYATEDLSPESAIPSGSNVNDYLGKLLNQNKKEGSAAVIKDESEFLYCLIIKHSSPSTPTRNMVFSALQEMKNHAQKNYVKNIVIPKTEKCGDDFEWSEVKRMLEYLFKNSRTTIFLASLPQTTERNKNNIQHKKAALHQMKSRSIILYLCSEDGHFSEEMKSLNKKFKFSEEFMDSDRNLGDIIEYKDDDYRLYGCVVKKLFTDSIDFRALQKCIQVVNKINKTAPLPLVGFQALKDEDSTNNYKIINILINNLEDVYIQICWPGNLKDKMPSKK